MELDALEHRIDLLVTTLRAFNGFRSLWLAPDGEIWHAEPDEDLHDQGCCYIGTLMQPSREALTACVLPALPVDPAARLRVGRWTSPDLEGAALAAVSG